MCYCTVFALFYFDEFEGNFKVQALGGLYLEGQLNVFFLRLCRAYIIWRGLFIDGLTCIFRLLR